MTNNPFSPFQVLATSRLILRQLSDKDAEEVLALRSSPDVNRFLGRKPAQTIDDARTFIQVINENLRSQDSLYWSIVMIGEDMLIGTICLFNLSASSTEIGYELLPAFHGKGLMQEAMSRVIEFCSEQLQLDFIYANTHPDNTGSTKLLEKLSFDRLGRMEDQLVTYRLKLTPGSS